MAPKLMKMPLMLYGTAWKADRTTELVVQAVLKGFRGIDTACQPKHYRQELVGQALRILATQHGIPREQLFLQTKFTSLDGQDMEKPLPYDQDAPLDLQVRQSFATSLKQLETTYIDSLVMHSPMSTRTETAIVWKEFEALVASGQVGQIGISNIYDPQLLDWMFTTSRIKPSVVQNRFRAATEYDASILALCARHNAKYQSFWTLSANPDLLASSAVRTLAQAYSPPLAPAQALFKFLIQSTKFGKGTIVPLNGTSNERHMEDAVRVMQLVESEGDGDDVGNQALAERIWG